MSRTHWLIAASLFGCTVAAQPAAAGVAAVQSHTSAPQIRACNQAFVENTAELGYSAARGLYSECLTVVAVEKPVKNRTPKSVGSKHAFVKAQNVACHTYQVGFNGLSAPRVCMRTAFSR